ncbi:MAG: TIGR03546 family protein [Bdellovibrionaceae bacterium]|nr:TIGR03546 family protein [Pseudobdellovibrionaceae bacterium]|tara:strand:- start:57713 stop:58237 length:525 start_codon:yes stop_codon:yes gene_type:complete
MGLLLKQIFNFLKILNSDTGTNQIAAGIATGFILGMTPAMSLQTFLVVILMFIFRIQIGAALLATGFFAVFAYILDPVFDSVGQVVLEAGALQGLFTSLYNMPILPFTRFNNSVVMGSGVVGFALAPFIFLLARVLVQKYREKVVARFKETKFWKAVKATSLYKWYVKYDELYG